MSRPSGDELIKKAREEYIIQQRYKGDTAIGTAVNLANWAIDEALKGTVQIPDESEWPEWADSVWIYYNNDSCNLHANLIKEVKRRSKPSWTPKKGDAVFYISNNLKVVMIGRFIMMDAVGNYQITSIHGNNNWIEPNSIKPFDSLKIGLPWGEI